MRATTTRLSPRTSLSPPYNLADAAGYTVHGALFDEKGALLSTDQALLKPPKLIISKPLQAQYSQEISLGFGITGRHAARYQLADYRPHAQTSKNSGLGSRWWHRCWQYLPAAGRGLSVVLKPEQANLTPRVAMRLPDDPENLRLHAVQNQQSLALKPQSARSGIELSRSTFNLNLNLSSLSTLSETPAKAPDASLIGGVRK